MFRIRFDWVIRPKWHYFLLTSKKGRPARNTRNAMGLLEAVEWTWDLSLSLCWHSKMGCEAAWACAGMLGQLTCPSPSDAPRLRAVQHHCTFFGHSDLCPTLPPSQPRMVRHGKSILHTSFPRGRTSDSCLASTAEIGVQGEQLT